MNREEILRKVKAEVEALAAVTVDDPDALIFKSGILDSLNVLNIITFIENEFKIQINPFDVNLDILGSIQLISDYVEKQVRE